MRKRLSVLIVLLVVAFGMVNLGAAEKQKPGTGFNGGSLELLPPDSTGVFTFNFQKFAGMPFFDKIYDKMIGSKANTPENKNPLKMIFESSGLDLKKDFISLSLGFVGDFLGKESPDFVIVIRANYNKSILSMLEKAMGPELKKEAYSGESLYIFKDDKETIAMDLPDGKYILAGTPRLVKESIDRLKGKAKTASPGVMIGKLKSPEFIDALLSFSMPVSSDMKKGVKGDPDKPEAKMFAMNLDKAESVLGLIDLKDNTWSTLIELISRDEVSNQQVASTLNGLKGMAAMAGPEFMEAFKNLNITGSAQGVRLEGSMTDETLQKLIRKINEKKEAEASQESIAK